MQVYPGKDVALHQGTKLMKPVINGNYVGPRAIISFILALLHYGVIGVFCSDKGPLYQYKQPLPRGHPQATLCLPWEKLPAHGPHYAASGFHHYTMVLPVLFLARGRHYLQDALTNHVIMGVLFSIILPVRKLNVIRALRPFFEALRTFWRPFGMVYPECSGLEGRIPTYFEGILKFTNHGIMGP